MRPLTRFASVATATLLGLTGLVLTTGSAQAAPSATLVGSAPATAHGPNTITFSYQITLPTDVDAAVFATHQAAAVPAATTGVTLDGAPVPAAQISQPSSVDIAVQAGPLATDGLTAGTHTLTFTSPIAATGSGSTSSTATLSWSVAGTPDSVTSAPVLVEVNQPDLAVVLTPDSGEDQVGFLGTGRDLELAVDVSNNGYGAPLSTLTVALPAGMALGPNGVIRDSDGSALTCAPVTAANTVTCDLGPLLRGGASDPTLIIDLTTGPGATPGQTVPVTVSVAPAAGQGTDSNSANDSVSAQVLYTGSAALSYRITPSKSKVTLGDTTTVTLTVHNAGPQKAPETLGFAIVLGNQFKVTGFTGDLLPLDPEPASPTVAIARFNKAAAPADGIAVITSPEGTPLFWLVGDIPAGGSVSAVLTLKAQRVGKAQLGLLAVSGAGDPNCDAFDCNPSLVTLSVVKPVAVVSTPTPTPAPTSSAPVAVAGGGSGVDGLANTGASSRPAVFGVLFLVAGIGLVLFSRRRLGIRA